MTVNSGPRMRVLLGFAIVLVLISLLNLHEVRQAVQRQAFAEALLSKIVEGQAATNRHLENSNNFWARQERRADSIRLQRRADSLRRLRDRQ